MIHRISRNIVDIYDEEDGDHYIGSSRNFTTRCRDHKNKKKQPVHIYINNNGGWNDWCITIIESHDNLTPKTAHTHERWLIELYGSKLNTRRPIQTKDELIQQHKQYRVDTREQQKQYRIDHTEQRKQYMKQYCIDHTEQKKQYDKQRRINHKK